MTNLMSGKRSQTFRNCLYCGRNFGPLNNLSVKYCSKRCAYDDRRNITSSKKGRKYPHLRRAETRECLVCGEEFRAVGDHINRKQKYCSRKCFYDHWRTNVQPQIKRMGTPLCERPGSWKGNE